MSAHRFTVEGNTEKELLEAVKAEIVRFYGYGPDWNLTLGVDTEIDAVQTVETTKNHGGDVLNEQVFYVANVNHRWQTHGQTI